MTRPEMNRRMKSIPLNVALRVLGMIRDGYGARSIVLEAPVSLKQANALFAWRERYGSILPGANDCEVNS